MRMYGTGVCRAEIRLTNKIFPNDHWRAKCYFGEKKLKHKVQFQTIFLPPHTVAVSDEAADYEMIGHTGSVSWNQLYCTWVILLQPHNGKHVGTIESLESMYKSMINIIWIHTLLLSRKHCFFITHYKMWTKKSSIFFALSDCDYTLTPADSWSVLFL